MTEIKYNEFTSKYKTLKLISEGNFGVVLEIQ